MTIVGSTKPEERISVPSLIDSRASKVPSALAIRHGDRSFDYAELEQRSTALACALRALGVRREHVVAVCLSRSAAGIVAALGIMKAGAAYLPLDPSHPKRRLQFELSDAGAGIVLTHAHSDDGTWPPSIRNIPLEIDGTFPVGFEAGTELLGRAQADPIAPDDLAYVIYTSGSTGQPKGVEITHAALSNLVAWHCSAFRVGELDRASHVSSVGFDAAVWEVWPYLCAGASVHVADDAVAKDAQAMHDWLLTQRVTIGFASTPLAERLVEFAWPPTGSLRVLLTGADTLHNYPPSNLPFEFHNNYGPTETAVVATSGRILPSHDGGRPPIGLPVDNVRIAIVGEHGEPVSHGAEGEIWIGGAGVARGYRGRPELTAEKFVRDPFDPTGRGRMYRSGDRGRLLPDGQLAFLGRLDEQMKIRGFRVEPREIETLLDGHPLVRESAVVVQGSCAEDERLVAYVVLRSQSTPAVSELQNYLAERLTSYMIPSLFVALASLPLTERGKIDRPALSARIIRDFLLDDAYVAPRTPIEAELVALIAPLLKLERVSVEDNFFLLGGHSLLGTQVIARVRDAFGVRIGLRFLFESPTIAALAADVERLVRLKTPALSADARSAAAPVAAPAEIPSQTEQRAQPIALSLTQRRLWLLAELQPTHSTYNCPFAFRLIGDLDEDALQRALNTLIRRHDVLRAVLTVSDGEPAYVVDATFNLNLATLDLSPRETLGAVLVRESTRPFDLRAAPPLRALLVRVGAGERVLLLTFHHIAIDGWSMAVFARELGALYAAYRVEAPSPLETLDYTYADFARWQRARLAAGELDDSIRYWKEQLRDPPPFLDVAPGRTGSAQSPSRGRLRSRTLPGALRSTLDTVGWKYGSTRFSLLLAAFSALLHRYSGQRDLVVGSAIANRTRSEFEGLIGFFVNTLVLRTRLDGDPDFGTWLAAVHAMTLDAFEHQDLPFQTLVEEVHPKRVAAHTPFVNVMFVLQNAPAEPLALDGLEVTTIGVERTTAKFDLTLEVTETENGLTIAFEYRTDLFEEGAIDALLDAFETLLDAIGRDPERPLSQYPLVTPVDERRQVVEWNATASPLSGRRVERLFEQWAQRAPSAVAVVDGDRRLSYNALNERANQLAHYLRSLGVTSADRVGLCVRRGADLIVALLAILKAGGTYVPLDPHDPGERLALMLADARVTIVLTDADVPQLGNARMKLVRVDRNPGRLGGFAITNLPEREAGNGTPALIIYTSGSAGRPKGVLVPHRGIERLVAAPNYVEIGPGDAVAQASTVLFDAATFEIWGALLNGARIVFVAKDVLLAPAALHAAIARYGISIMFLTTSLFREISRGAPATFASLRYLLVGGEALDIESVNRLFAGARPAKFRNMYGPTEATTFATFASIDAAPPASRSIPIGRPITNTEVYLFDAGGKLLPVGASGELHVGGPGVALGYLDDRALNRSKFVPHPFSADPDARLYATGDRARYRSDGTLEFLGRSDHQFKRNGFRVEPSEIEAALRASPGVRDAAVVAPEEAAGQRRIIGYVAVEDPQSFATDLLERRLRDRLPAHLVPDAIVALAALPLNSSGKVDCGALRAAPRRGVSDLAVPPTNRVEQQLVALWERLLDVRPIGIRCNFFELGGHSLLAVRMIAEIEKMFPARLPLSLLFELPTIEHLATALRSNAARDAPDKPMITVNAEGTAPPLFFLHGSIKGSGYYSLGLAKRLGENRPTYILRPHGVDGSRIPATIEAMAADYLEIIRAVRPHGPYVLGGWCNGALVAFEMARQLREQNEPVDNVILVEVDDASRPLRWLIESVDSLRGTLRISPYLHTRVVRWIARAPSHLHRLKIRSARHALVRKAVSKLSQSGRIFERLPAPRGPHTPAPRNLALEFARVSESYVPRRYDGRITLFVARERARERTPGAGWRTVAPSVIVRTIPGNHLTCITEYFDETAAALADALSIPNRVVESTAR